MADRFGSHLSCLDVVLQPICGEYGVGNTPLPSRTYNGVPIPYLNGSVAITDGWEIPDPDYNYTAQELREIWEPGAELLADAHALRANGQRHLGGLAADAVRVAQWRGHGKGLCVFEETDGEQERRGALCDSSMLGSQYGVALNAVLGVDHLTILNPNNYCYC